MRVLLVLIVTTFSLACGDLRELFTLQRGLAAAFHTNAINISLSGRHLTVMFANSPISELSDSEQGAFARNVADRIVFMHQGRVWEQGPPAKLFASPETPELASFIASSR